MVRFLKSYSRSLSLNSRDLSENAWIRSIKTKQLVLGLLILLFIISCGLLPTETSTEILPVKVLVSDSGMYKITAKDLRNVGWDVEQINTDNLMMTHRGKSVPFFVAGEGNTLELTFFGQAIDSSYTNFNVYFLTHNVELSEEFDFFFNDRVYSHEVIKGKIENSINTTKTMIPADGYLELEHLEENHYYIPQVLKVTPGYGNL